MIISQICINQFYTPAGAVVMAVVVAAAPMGAMMQLQEKL
jgi:hypothetical protein